MNGSRIFVLSLACGSLFAGAQALAAADYYLKIEGVEGELASRGAAQSVEVLSYSWGMSQSSTARVNPSLGAGAGKANVQDMSPKTAATPSAPRPAPDQPGSLQLVVPEPGNETAKLLVAACASGKHFDKVVLSGRGENHELHDVLVTSCDVTGNQRTLTLAGKHVKTGHITLLK
ncbi:MAG: type VI secretion system tube protein Hcp [Gammaproteobacteria bacterium]|nr:type VI secretion system tube protein Hcp [Gammaproteobacteria bacterium]